MRRRPVRLGRAAALSAVLVAVGVGGVPTTAAAHGGAAEISVVDQIPTGTTGFDFRVKIDFVLDEHPAVPATFQVFATGPDGASVEPTDLVATIEEGVYEASLEFPSEGTWDVTFVASLPPAELTQEVAVGESSGATPVPGGTEAEDEEATVVASGGSSVPLALVGGVIVAGLVTLIGLWLVVRGVRRRGRRSPSTADRSSGST